MAGQQFAYEFDDIGNRQGVGRGGTQLGGLRYETYANNALNQITSRTVPGYVDVLGNADATATVSVNQQPATARQNAAWWKEFPLDNSSSAVWQSLTNLSVTPQAGAALDKVTNIIGNVYLPQTPELFSYDADGNLTNDGRWVYTWDAENRLVKAESMSSAPVGSKRRVEFAYDFASRMIRRTEYDGSSGSYTLTSDLKYFYDGLRCMQEHNITSGLIHRSYVWGVDLSGSMGGAGGVGGLLSTVLHNQGSASGAYYPWYDANGNILGYVTSTNSSTRATYEYSPFGEMIRAEGDLAKLFPFRFSTKRYDDTLDLVQYEYRFYKPATGTWASRDPIGERGSKSLYTFLQNNAVNYFDPFGLQESPVLSPIDSRPIMRVPPTHAPRWTDHLLPPLGGSDYLQEDDWFDQNYYGWLEHARNHFREEIQSWIKDNCGKTPFNGPTTRLNVYPYYNNPGTSSTDPRSPDWESNETRFGDAPQSKHSADKVLGSFSIDVKTPVEISYSDGSACCTRYTWTATLYIEDVLGFQEHDGHGTILQRAFPSRRVTRAQFNLQGVGECCSE